MNRLDQHPQVPAPAKSEKAYDLLTRYKFAERYVEGNSVLCISCEEVGYGVNLLAGASDSVVGLSSSAEALELARTYYPAPNATYREADLPEIPYPDAHFDVVVAFEALEHFERPEHLISAAKRVLKPDGVFVASTPDKQAHSNERNYRDSDHEKEMYVSEFRELLERNFERVSVYRQGSVGGGMIFETVGGFSTAIVESADFFSPSLFFSPASPETHFALAVCGSSASSIQQSGLPYLLLERNRLIYDECDDQREDIRLLQDAIRQMQETEVQAFEDAKQIRFAQITNLKAQLNAQQKELNKLERQQEKLRSHREELKTLRRLARERERASEQLRKEHERASEQYKARIKGLEQDIHAIENSTTWRMLGAYRLARTKLNALIRSP